VAADVRLAGPDDAPAAGHSLSRAFRDDPLFEWFIPGIDKDARARRLGRFFVETMRMHLRLGGVWTSADHKGAALWIPPGQKIPLTRQLRTGVRYAGAVRRNVLRGVRALSTMEKHHPKDPPHWYLAVLGTDPDHQGKGIGSALLAPVLERADREGVPAYLESSKERNVLYYERFGFRVQSQLTIPKGGPPVWLMWRDPC